MAERHENGARIGYGRQAGFGNQAYILSVFEQGGQGLDFFRLGMFVQFVKFQFADMPFQTGPRKEAAGGPDFFYYEGADFQHAVQHRSRNHFAGLVIAQGRGKKI